MLAETRCESVAFRNPDCGRIVRDRRSDVLARIRESAVDLVLWDRRLSRDLVDWLSSLPTDRLPQGRVLVTKASLRDALEVIFEASGTPDDAPAAAFVDDLSDLAERFAAIAASNHVDLRLEVVRHDGCWKFHRDHVALRLLTTYLGPATQYVAPADAAHALRTQRAYDGPVESVPEHDVALFKGALSASACGIVHRSPPIAGREQVRLLLCLNPPSAASPELWSQHRAVGVDGAARSRNSDAIPLWRTSR